MISVFLGSFHFSFPAYQVDLCFFGVIPFLIPYRTSKLISSANQTARWASNHHRAIDRRQPSIRAASPGSHAAANATGPCSAGAWRRKQIAGLELCVICFAFYLYILPFLFGLPTTVCCFVLFRLQPSSSELVAGFLPGPGGKSRGSCPVLAQESPDTWLTNA